MERPHVAEEDRPACSSSGRPLSKKPDQLIRRDLDALRDEDRLTPDLVFRDPYFLDFLGLPGAIAEKGPGGRPSSAELEAFILELGDRLRLSRPAEADHGR